MFDTLEEFFCAEALEYIDAWRQSTPDNPAGMCGPIGPTEQLPLVARMVNALELELGKLEAHFWGMDEWVDAAGTPVATDFPLSFAKADKDLCFDRIVRNWPYRMRTCTFRRATWRPIRPASARSGVW